jgi:hypothetical protein
VTACPARGQTIGTTCDRAPAHPPSDRDPPARRSAAPGGARRRVLRPRPHPDGGLVGVPVRARRLPVRADVAAGAGARRVGEPRVPAAGVDRRRRRRAPRAGLPALDRRAGARPAAARAGRAGRRAPAALSEDARDRLRPPGRRPADLHLHRRLAGDGRADGHRAHLRRCGGLGLGGARRRLHRQAGRPVHLPRGQGRGDPRAGRSRGHRSRRVVGLLGLRVRPADAARGRPRGGGQPRRRARAGGARGGLGGAPLRPARPRVVAAALAAAAIGGAGSAAVSRGRA